MSTSNVPTLTKTLGTVQLWGIAVGLVISGEYVGHRPSRSPSGRRKAVLAAQAAGA